MAVQVYVYKTLEDRNKNSKEGGTLKGEANNPEELNALVDASPHGPLGYFEGEVCLRSYDVAYQAVGGRRRFSKEGLELSD